MSRRDETRLVYSTEGLPPPAAAASTSKTTGRSARGGTPGKVRIRLDRRASDRTVTVITGLSGSPAELAALVRSLKAACGSGGTVKDGALELQGDHRETVEKALRAAGLIPG